MEGFAFFPGAAPMFESVHAACSDSRTQAYMKTQVHSNVCVCTYIHIHIYIYIYIYVICVYISMYIYTSMYDQKVIDMYLHTQEQRN